MWLVLVFIGSMNPLTLLLTLIGALFILSLCVACLTDNYLFAYLVFLLFASGLIMLLMYFCSIILNEKCLLASELGALASGCLATGLAWAGVRPVGDAVSVDVKQMTFEFFNVMKYLTYSYSAYSLFFISYLFLCLVVVYEVVKRCGGPLRMKT